MLDFVDLVGGPLKVLLEKSIASKLGTRLALTYELALAATISFLIVCGGALTAGRPTVQAVGSGMFFAGIAMFATFQTSDNAKGLKIAVTQKAADGKFDNPTTTIERK